MSDKPISAWEREHGLLTALSAAENDRDAALARAEEAERQVAALTAAFIERHHDPSIAVMTTGWDVLMSSLDLAGLLSTARAEGAREATEMLKPLLPLLSKPLEWQRDHPMPDTCQLCFRVPYPPIDADSKEPFVTVAQVKAIAAAIRAGGQDA